MSEQIKVIIQALNHPPFSRNYNIITFDELEPLALLQALNDILAHISQQHEVDIRQEEPKTTTLRMLNFLKLLKYNFPAPQRDMAHSLIGGEKRTIYPIMEWLLARLPDLKTRAYLAQYLVKIEVPPEFLADHQIQELYTRYDSLLGEFKQLHRARQQNLNTGISAEEVRKDIERMEEERDQLQNRLSNLKKRAEQIPNFSQSLEACGSLRKERDQKTDLAEQLQAQRNLISQADIRRMKLSEELKALQAHGDRMSGHTLLVMSEDELRLKKALAMERLPKEINDLKTRCTEIERIAMEPAMTDQDLDSMRNAVDSVNSEIEQLVTNKLQSMDTKGDDSLMLYRQQASMVSNKKTGLNSSWRDAAEQSRELQEELDKKREMAREMGATETLKGDDFKRYVSKLRVMSNTFKKKRQELNELKAEVGVLVRTDELLQHQARESGVVLEDAERDKGVHGFRKAQDTLEEVSGVKSKLDEQKGNALENMSQMIVKLSGAISEKKASLAPLIKQLRPFRKQEADLRNEHSAKKKTYDAFYARLEGQRIQTEATVKVLRQECMADESRYHYLQFMQTEVNAQQERVSNELKTYMGGRDSQKKKSLRDVYTRKIQESENAGKALREKQKIVKSAHNANLAQMGMWEDLQKLFACKLELADQQAHISQESIGDEKGNENILTL
ncbi:Intraflagellar transport protein 81-like [Oopsacas minuta]|uniref:Intraflagellar transport protein 81 homolog n=1 Tax=Oopsacas minuta TaxID=111878 RepID=A0AAV7K1K5_9METZ|nr:Intraflagellar transport protein 81-like [Oopsacas minuta]